jgi:AraC family L-rhamnose operon transcriptional activator RhaR
MQNQREPAKLNWTNFHQSTRRIVAEHHPNHGNYRIHDHEFMEIAFITSGTCLHQSVLGDSRPVAGDAFLLRPGAWHGYTEARNLGLYNCNFDTALLGHEMGWMVDDPSLGRFLWGIPLSPGQHGMAAVRLGADESAACRALLDQMAILSGKDYLSHHGDHLGLLVQILSLLARSAPPPPGNRYGKSHRAVTAALKLIDDAPADDWTLARLSELVQVERTYLVRLFRAAIGLPPMAYILRRRLELATKLLRQDGITISEAGAMAGWLDSNYFSRCFRQHFGMTPSRYRARFRERPVSG